ncbi:MAG: hypothetical protein J6W00_05130 [Lentisphaeria bacterium]|nr:hypothetical protein [Lentisphaeria bacterium]
MSDLFSALTELTVALLPAVGGFVIIIVLLALACYGFQMLRLFFKF